MSSRKNLPLWNIEVTDTFAGEANYCWVRRYQVRAKSERGAANILGRLEGRGWRHDGVRYNIPGACVCAFIDYCDE